MNEITKKKITILAVAIVGVLFMAGMFVAGMEYQKTQVSNALKLEVNEYSGDQLISTNIHEANIETTIIGFDTLTPAHRRDNITAFWIRIHRV